MRSRVAIASLLLAAAAGCGGDYSNADVEFAAAVPRRVDVTVSLPLQASASSGLRESGSLTSLVAGDPSRAASDTRAAADRLDQMAGFFISILEAVTRKDPDVRGPDLRLWGPFPNQGSPGWEMAVVVTRQTVQIDPADPDGPHEGFFWQILYRRIGEADWRQPSLVDGFYEPGEIRRGRGLVVMHAAEFRASGMATAKDLGDLGITAKIELGYDTRTGQPHGVALRVTTDAQDVGQVLYTELENGSGMLFFDVTQSDPQAEHVQALSRWTPEVAGRSDLVVVQGTAAGAHAVECWDGQQRVTFVDNPWDGSRDGDPLRCAFGPP